MKDEISTDGVLEGRDVLCFGHDWTGDPLSKTHIMRLISQNNRVLWINSIGYRKVTATARDMRRIADKLKKFTERVREVEPNLFVLGPLAIPVYDSPLVTGSVVTGSLGEDKIVYYCVDEFTAYSDAGTRGLVELEEKLLTRSDLVVVSAESLKKSKQRPGNKVELVRHGVQFDHFRKALDESTVVPAEIRDLPRPIIGYFGLMADDWIDVPLLSKIAQRFPQGSLVLLGKVTTAMSEVTRHPNVHLLGRKPFEDLPAYSKGFDVALNAFPINDVTLNANPLKVREYLASGLPVVSSKIPEVMVLEDLAYVAEDHDDFLSKLEIALKDPGPKRERSESMRGESWAGRYEELRRHLRRHGVC